MAPTENSRIYQYIVSKIARKVPFFAKPIVEKAMREIGASPATVTPSEMKALLKSHINPALKKYLPANTSIISIGNAFLETGHDNRIIHMNAAFRKLIQAQIGLDAGDDRILEFCIAEGYTIDAGQFEDGKQEFMSREVIFEKPFYQVYSLTVFPRLDEQTGICGVTSLFADITLDHELENEIAQMNSQLRQFRKTIQWELDFASRIQRSILPGNELKMNGLHFVSEYLPAGDVGGDYFDVISLSGHRTGVLLIDVSGHGIPAALITVMVKSLFLLYAVRDLSPDALLQELNHNVKSLIKTGEYMTAFYGIFSDDGTFIYANAGHTSGLLFKGNSDEVLQLESTGSVIGVMDRQIYELESHQVAYDERDLFVLFTDGITEVRNKEDEEYGIDRLISDLKDAREENLPAMAATVMQKTGAFCLNQRRDDSTLVMVESLFQPQVISGTVERARKEFKEGNGARAYGMLNELLLEDPSLTEVVLLMAEIKTDQKEFATAYDHFQQYFRLNPRQNKKALNRFAMVAFNTGQFEEAARAAHEVLNLDRDYAPAHNMLGIIQNRRERFTEALEHFKEAEKLRPGQSAYRKNRELVEKRLAIKV